MSADPSPSPDRIAWLQHMAALEEADPPFPGASGYVLRKHARADAGVLDAVPAPESHSPTRRDEAAPPIAGRFYDEFNSPEDCLQSAA